MVKVHSWGRLNFLSHNVIELTHSVDVIRNMQENTPGLAYGMGRSYGDVCLNPEGALWKTAGLDHFISFDAITGRLVCEAGVLLKDIQSYFIPRGWMLPVTPGTQWVTVGGAIANDVHGKNHHVRGSFGNHVYKIKLVRTNGEIIECSPDVLANWFAATVGGIGLTGVIVEVELQLQKVNSAWLNTETIPYANLKEFFMLSDQSESAWEYTVSWIDCLAGKSGRGIFMRANMSNDTTRVIPVKRPNKFPITPPISCINKTSLYLFNTAYYYLKKIKAGCDIEPYTSFFYPLDNLLDWNKMYGPKGFFQYQSVVPRVDGEVVIKAMLQEIAHYHTGSFLAVLKTFGDVASKGMLSFPEKGVTLALDFPNLGDRTHQLFARLDAIVREAKGRIYLAKDARLASSLFKEMYPMWENFLSYRDPGVSSKMSRRLMGE